MSNLGPFSVLSTCDDYVLREDSEKGLQCTSDKSHPQNFGAYNLLTVSHIRHIYFTVFPNYTPQFTISHRNVCRVARFSNDGNISSAVVAFDACACLLMHEV
jgi:hypothetical protein